MSVEINGPRNEQMESISLQPNEIRDAANYILQRCPRANGMGGFITQRFSNLVRFFTDPSNNLTNFHESFRKSSFASLYLPLISSGHGLQLVFSAKALISPKR